MVRLARIHAYKWRKKIKAEPVKPVLHGKKPLKSWHAHFCLTSRYSTSPQIKTGASNVSQGNLRRFLE